SSDLLYQCTSWLRLVGALLLISPLQDSRALLLISPLQDTDFFLYLQSLQTKNSYPVQGLVVTFLSFFPCYQKIPFHCKERFCGENNSAPTPRII
uniref:Uncharacterized protein n=1 Tax=Amazona collaria TaxID=241587 RepID=A0A8B9FW59_9PSIT